MAILIESCATARRIALSVAGAGGDRRTAQALARYRDTLTLRGLPRTPFGRKITSAALRVLETARAVPRGSFAIQEVLNVAADSLVAAGRLGIFTPMYFHKARKPG